MKSETKFLGMKVPEELFIEFKMMAEIHNTSMTAVLLDAIRKFVGEGMDNYEGPLSKKAMEQLMEHYRTKRDKRWRR